MANSADPDQTAPAQVFFCKCLGLLLRWQELIFLKRSMLLDCLYEQHLMRFRAYVNRKGLVLLANCGSFQFATVVQAGVVVFPFS